MCSKQCMGITKKGARCLIKVSGGEFCHYHVPNIQPSPTKTRHGPRHETFQATFLANSAVKPQKAKLPNYVPSKNYTTTALKNSERPPSPIKYNNLNRPSGNKNDGVKRPLDYSSIPSSSRLRNSPKVELAIQPGFIYVYTLSSFLQKYAEGGWVQTRNLSSHKRHQDKWVNVDMSRLLQMLIKVGMTTKTPALRIQQWESKCNHKLECLYPGSHPHLGKSSLTKMLSSLLLKEGKEAKKYSTYVESLNGFFVPRNILHCEQQIHQLLKNEFGRGEIHCTGCYEKQVAEVEHKRASIFNIFKSKEEPIKQDYNIHNEWFPIPRKSLSKVFLIINAECMKYVP